MIFNLVHPEARARAIQAVKDAPEGYRVTIKEQTRTLDQSAIFHALCNDLERSGLEWAGKKRTAEEWKPILISGHSVATKQGGEIIPGIEGEFVAIRESTARMGKRRASSLIEYTQAFIAAMEKK